MLDPSDPSDLRRFGRQSSSASLEGCCVPYLSPPSSPVVVARPVSRPSNLLLHNPITYFNCFGVQSSMHELQVALDIQCERGRRARRNRTLPWDIALLLQCLLVLEAIPGWAVGAHLRPIQRCQHGFTRPGGTTAEPTWVRPLDPTHRCEKQEVEEHMRKICSSYVINPAQLSISQNFNLHLLTAAIRGVHQR